MNRKHFSKTIIIIIGLTFCVNGTCLYAQTDKEKAMQKGTEAVSLMDEGKLTLAIMLLEQAQKLDPESIDYPYELALAHYMNKDYMKSIKILEQIIKMEGVYDRVYQLLGNAYDMSRKRKKAIEVYEAGLKLFPSSGILHLERGNMELFAKEYDRALGFYEEGIKADPIFPSNYYWASRLLCSSSEEVWGLIYGELFMNLEPNSKRTAEISKLIYNTYKGEILINNDSIRIDFCKVVLNSQDVINMDEVKLPFCFAFGQSMMLALIGVKVIDINTLDKIRTSFLEIYHNNGFDLKYPNVLYQFQDKVKQAGHLESYNHWVLMKGEEDAFHNWYKKNQVKYDLFVKWFMDNPIQLDHTNKFYREPY